MSTVLVTDPFAAVRQRIEEAGQRTDIEPEERLMLMREYEADLTSMLGLIGRYRGDAYLEQEARVPTMQEAIFDLREAANVRANLVEAGLFTGEEMDTLGFLSNDDITKLEEEGLLEAWVIEEWENVKFDPIKHPKGTGGRFIDVLGRVVAPKGRRGRKLPQPKAPKAETAPKATEPVKGAEKDAVHGASSAAKDTTAAVEEAPVNVNGDIARAAELISQGKRVELNQPNEVSTLLDKLREISQEAIAKGEKAKTYDLCKVTVKGTNLFCQDSKGVPRIEMPQLEGVPSPGSKADSLPKSEKGYANLGDAFTEHLRSQGVNVTSGKEKASHLRATQDELNGAVVARIAGEIEQKGRQIKPIFISRDNYIVDGHHGWAATVGVDARDNKTGDLDMDVERIDMPITDILDQARQFTSDMGIGAHGVGGDGEVLQKVQDAGLNEWPTPGPEAQKILGDAKDTRDLHTVETRGAKGTRVYTPERKILHDRIIDTLLRARQPVDQGNGVHEHQPHPNGEFLQPEGDTPRALFMAGGTASGKSTALALSPDATPPQAVHIDPDEIKTMLPEYVQMTRSKDRYAASAVHEESSDLAKRLHDEASARNLNIVLDGTGDSGSGKFAGKIKSLKEKGYQTELLYVNAPTDVAIERATQRAQRTGRWVPVPEIQNQHTNVSARFPEVQALVNDGTVGRIRMYDTGGNEPVLMAEGGNGAFHVRDAPKFDAFLAKGHGGEQQGATANA